MGRPGSHYGAEPGDEAGSPGAGYPQGVEQPGQSYPRSYPQPPTPQQGSYPQVVHSDGAGPVEKRRRRRWPILVAVMLVGLLLLGAGGWRWWQARVQSATPSPSGNAEPLPGPVLAQLAAGTGVPNGSILSQQLEPLINGSELGKRVSVSVVDLRTGQVIYERDPSNTVIPASNTKLVTAAAVLATRGAAYQITTQAVAGTNPGEVVLVGAGDATLAVEGEGYYAGAARLDQLAEQVKLSLIHI